MAIEPRVRSGRIGARLLVGSGLVALAVVLLVAAAALASNRPTATDFRIDIRFSRFEPSEIVVPAGVPVRITLTNHDPIDHEWIVGDEAVHAVHRVGTEPLHPDRPTEVVLPIGETRTTVVTFDSPGQLKFICHLPAHESFGMVGTVIIR